MIVSFMGILIAAGHHGSSRVYLEAHNPAQVYTGFFTGFVVMMGVMLVY